MVFKNTITTYDIKLHISGRTATEMFCNQVGACDTKSSVLYDTADDNWNWMDE